MRGNNKSIWDDPEWHALRQQIQKKSTPKLSQSSNVDKNRFRQPLKKQAKKQSIKQPETHEVSLNLTLPSLKLPKLPSIQSIGKLNRTYVVRGLAIFGLIGIVFLSNFLFRKISHKSTESDTLGSSATAQQPDFTTLLPEGNVTSTKSGKLVYDPSRKVASYTDTIENVDITVSQQMLPESFKNNPDKELQNLAESFSANEIIPLADQKAYLGTSAKGPQTVLLHKNNLLIFMYSTGSIDKKDWSNYIVQLR